MNSKEMTFQAVASLGDEEGLNWEHQGLEEAGVRLTGGSSREGGHQ